MSTVFPLSLYRMKTFTGLSTFNLLVLSLIPNQTKESISSWPPVTGLLLQFLRGALRLCSRSFYPSRTPAHQKSDYRVLTDRTPSVPRSDGADIQEGWWHPCPRRPLRSIVVATLRATETEASRTTYITDGISNVTVTAHILSRGGVVTSSPIPRTGTRISVLRRLGPQPGTQTGWKMTKVIRYDGSTPSIVVRSLKSPLFYYGKTLLFCQEDSDPPLYPSWGVVFSHDSRERKDQWHYEEISGKGLRHFVSLWIVLTNVSCTLFLTSSRNINLRHAIFLTLTQDTSS